MKYFFMESPEFTKRIVKLGLEAELAEVQRYLLENPRGGALEPGACGLRKIRVRDSTRGQGKRFGARIHYAFVPRDEVIYFITVYRKDQQEMLTADEKRVICRYLHAWGAE